MQVVHTIAALRAALSGHSGCSFVPTMGHLHAGHLALVRTAATLRKPVVASVFVNRLQFLPHEDFDRYPRTLEHDCAQLATVGCDLVFAPDETELYPQAQAYRVQPPPELADCLEGAFRPGFFTGVCTVVTKLFACVQPQVALFGQKDYQQLLIIQGMVRQLNLPIQIVGVSTERDGDGLALSSRNSYLTPEQRAQAAQLWRTLQTLSQEARHPERALATLEAQAFSELTAQGWRPDYLTLRCRDTLQPPTAEQRLKAPLVALGAAWLGQTRLIDNLEC
jgi:pantoate--beta-alanine ligase